MRFLPHPYQAKAIDWVVEKPRCCLFLDMGLGKTICVLTAAARLLGGLDIDSVLVIAPKKVAEATWAQEAEKWDHLSRLSTSVILGTAKQRLAAMAAPADIYVTSRDNVAWLVEQHGGRLPYDMVVLDELTSFKGHKSKRFKALCLGTKNTPRVVGLTGTPAPNGLLDLWAQMRCVDLGRRLGPSFAGYRAKHFDCVERNNVVIKARIKKGHEDEIRGAIADICLTMTASDYLQLPPLVVEDRWVELSPSARADYALMERDGVLAIASEAEGGADSKVIAANAAALMSKLMQMANGAVYDEDGRAVETGADKLDALAELAESLAAQGEPLLVFYQFKHDAERIAARIPGCVKYSGEADLRAWNEGRIAVLLAHPASTAYGLNMQAGGRHIAWFGVGFNLELYLQANARLHRQGQEKPVIVCRLLARGTADQHAAHAINNKESGQRALINGLKRLMKKHGCECDL